MHANARLTPIGRLTMVMRIETGRPVAHVAAEMGISRPTAYKWWHRWDELGAEGLVDRSSRPRSCPHQTSPVMEAQIEELRRTLKLGPARIGYRLGVPPSTVHRVLTRLGIHRLSWMDRPTGAAIGASSLTRPSVTSSTARPGHIDLRPTARWSGSTAPCSRNGPTSGPTPQRRSGSTPSVTSCMSTIITAATPPLGGNLPSAG